MPPGWSLTERCMSPSAAATFTCSARSCCTRLLASVALDDRAQAAREDSPGEFICSARGLGALEDREAGAVRRGCDRLGLTAGPCERLHRIREILDDVLEAGDHVFELGDFSPCLGEEWF
jgi:hypothetical protein